MKFVISALISILLAACVSDRKCACGAGNANSPEISQPAVMPAKQPFSYEREKAEQLFKGLKAIGVKPVKEAQVKVYTAYELACSVDMSVRSGAATKCEFWESPAGTPNRKKHEVRGQDSYEDLRSFLFQYPVEQGDPGAMTHFAQCRVSGNTPDCSLAIQVNYDGP